MYHALALLLAAAASASPLQATSAVHPFGRPTNVKVTAAAKLPEPPLVGLSVAGLQVRAPTELKVFYENVVNTTDFSLTISVTYRPSSSVLHMNEDPRVFTEDCSSSVTNVNRFFSLVDLNLCASEALRTPGKSFGDLLDSLIPQGSAPSRRSGFSPLVDEFVFDVSIQGGGFSYTVDSVFTLPRGSARTRRVSWPLGDEDTGVWPPTRPSVVGNIMENYQSFSSPAYWHQGLDIRSNLESSTRLAGRVYSPVDGVVVQRVRYSSSDLYWSLMVQDEVGFIWQYHHLSPSTFTKNIGDSVKVGDLLGRIIQWPSQYNKEYYHHTHLNVAIANPNWKSIPNPYVDGWSYVNPITLFDSGNFTNKNSPPYFPDGTIYFLPNEGTTALGASDGKTVAVVKGDVDIVVAAFSEFEEVQPVGGYPYPNGVYEISYEIEPVELMIDGKVTSSRTVENADVWVRATVPAQVLMRNDKMPNNWSYASNLEADAVDRYLPVVYKESFKVGSTTKKSVLNYSNRQLYYTVSNTLRGEPHDTLGFWDTDDVDASGARVFPDGTYSVTVRAGDAYGNTFSLTRNVEVKN